MATFGLRFITESDPISAAIRRITNSLWSHVDIIMPNGSYLGARHEGGVQVRLPDYVKVSRERRYQIPVSDDSFQMMFDFALAQVGKPYDTKDIFGILTNENWHKADSWICSELAIAVPWKGGLRMLNVDPGFTFRVTPEMLHLSPKLIGYCTYSFEG